MEVSRIIEMKNISSSIHAIGLIWGIKVGAETT